jgi:hypothetical protein
MHFESGNCSSCRGVENARRAAYQLCMQQPGGANFLTNPLMITDGGGAGGGYTDEGPNYKCNHCYKQFKFLSSLMQHQQTSACLHASSQQINLRIGNGPAVQEFKFFHGTTWTKACQIRDNGFIPSSGGCLGFGITSSLVYYTRIRDCKNTGCTGTNALAFIESITSVIFELSTSALSSDDSYILPPGMYVGLQATVLLMHITTIPGIYVAREEKATRFALLRAEETGQHGGLVELLVTVRNPKFVLSNDSCWQDEGYDA